METSTIIFITLLIFLGGNLAAFIYSWLVLYTGTFKNLRIQKVKYKTDIFYKRFPLIMVNILLIMVTTVVALYFFSGIFETAFAQWWIIPVQILIIALVDDLWFYAAHRLLHANKFMLRHIHSIHHRAVTPHPMEYMYEHPLEWMAGSVGVALGISVVLFSFDSVSIYAFWIYGALRNLHEMNLHSGIKSVINPYIPLLKNAEDHDLHHSKADGNYASMFTIWDRIFGTISKP